MQNRACAITRCSYRARWSAFARLRRRVRIWRAGITEASADSRCHDFVLEIRSLAIAQSRLQFLVAASLGSEPRRHVFRTQIDDASVVSGGFDLRGRLVGDGGERLQSTFLRI